MYILCLYLDFFFYTLYYAKKTLYQEVKNPDRDNRKHQQHDRVECSSSSRILVEHPFFVQVRNTLEAELAH